MKLKVSKEIAALWAIPAFMCAVPFIYDLPVGVEPIEPMQCWFPIAMAVISAVSAIGSAAAGNAQKRKTRRALNERQSKLDAWRDQELGMNYLDRADAQAAQRMVKEAIDENMKSLNSDAIKTGMTDEAKAAAASKMTRSYADAVSRIAGLGEQHRQRVQDIYMQQSGDVTNQRLALNSTGGAQNTFDTIGQVAGSLGSIVGSYTKTPTTTPAVSTRAGDMASQGYLPGNQTVEDWERNKYRINI